MSQYNTQGTLPPTVPLLKKAGINVEELQRRYFFTKRGKRLEVRAGTEDFDPMEDEDGCSGLEEVGDGREETCLETGIACVYLGSVSVGIHGDITHSLGMAMDKVLSHPQPSAGQPCVLRVSELCVGLGRPGGELVASFPYPDISSCGRLTTRPNYFAFISSELGTLDTQDHDPRYDSMCHVFHSPSQDLVEEVLSHISDGFHRTYCAV